MGQPRRFQPSRSARLSSGALSYTTLPEVLEHSTLRLSDVEHSEEGTAGQGILVKLFRVLPKDTRPVGDSKRPLWIVSSPDASHEFLSRWKDVQKSGAKTSKATEAGSLDERKAKVKLTNGKAKGRRPPVRGKGNPLMSDERGKGDNVEPDDSSDEEEDGAENDNDEEVEEGGNGEEEEEEEEAEQGDTEEVEAEESAAEESEAEESKAEAEEAEEEQAEEEEAEEEEAEEEAEGEDGTENHNAAKDVVTERNVMESVEQEHDAEEQGDDRHNGEHDEAQANEANEADKRKDREDRGEEDRNKVTQDAGAEGEHGAEETGDELERHSKTKEKDGVDEDQQREDDAGDEEEEMGNHDEVREETESMEQRVIANDCDGARGDFRLADIVDKEVKERDTGSGGVERMAGEENRDPEGGRKRPLGTCEPFDCPTPGDHPNKRSKGDDSESEDTAATDDFARRTFSPEATPRLRTPSPTFVTVSPSSAITIVRQTSAVPGLEDTEKAVWDAAHRDSVIRSLPSERQTKLIHAALSLSSEEGIKELRRFVHNARKDGSLRGKSLESDSNLSAPHSGVDVWHAASALVPRDSGLDLFSNLYRQIDVLDDKATLFSITRRVKLAAIAQHRKGLLQEGAGKNQARDVNLYLFRAIYPDHATIERPDDKVKNLAAHNDWIRLRDRLREGRLWLEVRELFGGVGAFLALPPQCVPDRHVVKMPAKTFESWLRLLDVAWRALDPHARLTLNDLVRLSVAGQSLPEGSLMLEMLEDGTGTAPISLSDMLAGWPTFDRNSTQDEVGLTATLT
jgi:hypothetical protein